MHFAYFHWSCRSRGTWISGGGGWPSSTTTRTGKLAVIGDVIDHNRALVDAPNIIISYMNFKRLSLTDIKIDIKRILKKKILVAAMEVADVKRKWEKSLWGRKLIVLKRRDVLNDFDRFKLMLVKIKVGVIR